MSDIIKFENIQDRIVVIRDHVRNNPDKFPDGYVIELNKTEWEALKSKFSTSIKGGKVKLPSAFPEKGLLC